MALKLGQVGVCMLKAGWDCKFWDTGEPSPIWWTRDPGDRRPKNIGELGLLGKPHCDLDWVLNKVKAVVSGDWALWSSWERFPTLKPT